jgi:FkbM family methyltransferase
MLMSYMAWCFHRSLRLGGPVVRATHEMNIKLSRWQNFSEYWSFRNGLPVEEFTLLAETLPVGGGGAIAVDCGANVGLFTLALVGLGFARVHAFEPYTPTFERLRDNVYANSYQDNVILNNLAIGESVCTVNFEVDEKSPATNHACTGTVGEGKKAVEVPVTTLDEYCILHRISRISFLKVDVEGMEPAVLRGAADLLHDQAISAILCEVCPANLRQVGSSIEDLYNSFSKHGYSAFSVEPPHRAYLADDLAKMSLKNVLICPTQSV